MIFETVIFKDVTTGQFSERQCQVKIFINTSNHIRKTCGVFKVSLSDLLNQGKSFLNSEKSKLSKCPDPEATCHYNIMLSRIGELELEELLVELQSNQTQSID